MSVDPRISNRSERYASPCFSFPHQISSVVRRRCLRASSPNLRGWRRYSYTVQCRTSCIPIAWESESYLFRSRYGFYFYLPSCCHSEIPEFFLHTTSYQAVRTTIVHHIVPKACRCWPPFRDFWPLLSSSSQLSLLPHTFLTSLCYDRGGSDDEEGVFVSRSPGCYVRC